MRNLKKVFAVILAVALMASMMVPALAAVSHEAEALKLQAIGLMAGGPADLKLEEGVTRVQGLTFAIRAAGKEADAIAMTDAEVAAELAKFTDADKIPAWAKKYTAYAIKNNITVGVGGGKFAPLEPISGTSFLVFLLKSGMGYADVTTGNVVDVAYAAKVLSVSEALTYGTKTALIRDDAAAILYGAAKNGVNKDGKTLIQSLIDSGFVAKDDAVDAGFIEAAPAKFEVVDVSADNLIQAVVEFNQPADKDSAGNKDNYKFATADKITVKNVAVSEDGTSATLTFEAGVAQQKKAALTISGVKSANGIVMEKVTKEVSFLDKTIPSIVATEVVGISTIKVTFSEPMSKVQPSDFKVNDGKYYVKGVTAQKNNTEFLVELYVSLKTGELPFEVKVGPTDYAGFTAMGFIGKLAVNEDKEAPSVVSFKDAKPNSIVLVWNEDIVVADSALSNFYHTNGNNKATKVEVDGNEMTLTFAKADKLPNGTAYVYVLKDAVKDLWNNKNAQQMTKVEVDIDNDAPVLKTVEAKKENTLELTFDEVVYKEHNTRANYTVLDKDGKEVKKFIQSITQDGKKITLVYSTNFGGGNYTLVVKNLEDFAGNAMPSTSVEFAVTDKTDPAFTGFSAKLYTANERKETVNNVPNITVKDQIIKISFGESMATEGAYSVDDLSKYVIVGNTAAGQTLTKQIKSITDASISVVDDGNAVEIVFADKHYKVDPSSFYLPSDVLPVGKAVGDYKSGTQIKVARVADAAGNYTVDFEGLVAVKDESNITISEVQLIAADKVKVIFSDVLAKFEPKEVLFSKTGANPIANVTVTGIESRDNVDGKTEVVYTLDTKYAYDKSDLSVKTALLASGSTEHVTANMYGETLLPNTTVTNVKDKLAPVVAKIALDPVNKPDDKVDDVKVVWDTTATTTDGVVLENNTGTITITFTEAIKDNTVSFLTFSVDGCKLYGDGITVKPYDVQGNKVILKIQAKADGTSAKPVVSQVYNITDMDGNALESGSSWSSY